MPGPGSGEDAAEGAEVRIPAPSAEPAGVDLARVALRAAREQARARGALTRQKRRSRTAGTLSGARRDGRDPLPLGAAIERLKTERGWEMPMAVGGVMGRWPELVGPDLARHCVPQSYDEQERVLSVRCDSTAWATQVRLLAPQLVARLNADLGQGTVKVIRVRGPEAPDTRHGRLRAPGSRGPGDTYG
ncbi:DUF721 domain-containing protein [Streptomyces sp. TRM 70361]|uniref:DUF721 domain-containing protein n=1 Tax=Streptomyces sp. TRM 70361 TaxID=3116553 RepID=UPI003FCD807E